MADWVVVIVTGAGVAEVAAGGSSEHDAPPTITTNRASSETAFRCWITTRIGAGKPSRGFRSGFPRPGDDSMAFKILRRTIFPKATEPPRSAPDPRMVLCGCVDVSAPLHS